MFDFGASQRADGGLAAPTTTVNLSSALGLSDRGRPSHQQIRRQLRGTIDATLRKRAELFARSCVPGGEHGGLMVKRETSDGMEPVEEDHPWVSLLRAPNEYRSAYDFWYWVRFAADVQGTAPMIVRDDGLGVPDGLLEVFPSFGEMKEQINREGGIGGYVYHRSDGRDIQLGADDVVTVKRTDPTTPHGTMSILESLVYEAASDRAAAEFRQKTYSEGRPPLIYMSSEQNVGGDRAKEMGERFKSEYLRGNGDVKGVPVMHSGMELDSLGIDPDAYQMLESQELDHEVIFRVTGINSAYLDQGSNRAEAEQAERSILTGTIQPLLNQTSAQLTLAFRNAFGADESLQIVPPDVTPVDREEQETINEMRVRRGVPPAQIMEEEGEEVPDEFADDLEQPHIPNTLKPVGSGGEAFL